LTADNSVFQYSNANDIRMTQDLNSFGEIIVHAQCSVDEKIYRYIPCVPHKNNCKKKIGSHDMKQTDSSIIIVRNVCVLNCLSFLHEVMIGNHRTKAFLHEVMMGNHRNKTTES
jgi:hypothetical protein